VVVLGVRLAVALSRLDDATFQYYTANIAVALLEGLPLERAELPLIPHNRGSMIAGFVAVPFVALLGNTLLAIKCEAILLGALTGFFFVRVLERGIGRTAAWCGVLLVALLPPAFQILDVMPLGSHVDTALVDFGALAYLLSWERGRDAGPGRAFRLGLLSGFGLFFSFHFVVVLPALFLAWWASGTGVRAPRNLAAFGAGAALMVAPAALFLPDVAKATEVVNKPILEWLLAPGEALGKLVESVTTTWPLAWSFDAHGGPWARWAFGLAVVVGLALTVPRLLRRDPCALFLVAYPLLLLVAFSLTSFELNAEGASGLGSRQISPAMPFLAAWIAVGAQTLVDRGRRGAALVLVAPALVAGVAGVGALVDLDVWRGQPPVRGSDFSKFKQHVARAAERDPDRILAWLDELEPDWAGFRPFFTGDLRWEISAWEDLDAVLADARAIGARPPRHVPFLLVSLGRSVARDDALAVAVGELVPRVEAELGPDAVRYFLVGYGQGLLGRAMLTQLRRRVTGSHHGEPLPAFRHVATLPDDIGRVTSEGLGFAFGELVSPYHGALRGVLFQVARLPERLRRAFFVGMGWGYRTRYCESSYRVPEHLKLYALLPPEHLDDFRRGLAWGANPW
jgi:hypothetical protein